MHVNVDPHPPPTPADMFLDVGHTLARYSAAGHSFPRFSETDAAHLRTRRDRSTSMEERLAAQLMHLASHHHWSEYNRCKFGPRGSPMTYIPLSIQCPDHVQTLQSHQARCAEAKAWWPWEETRSEPVSDTSSTDVDEPFAHSPPPARATLGPCGAAPASASVAADLCDALAAAMQAPLERARSAPAVPPKPVLKTSASHPINVSMIIPPELLSTIAAHLTRNSAPRAPTLFEVQPAYSLDRLTAAPPTGPTTGPAPVPVLPAIARLRPSADPRRPMQPHGLPPVGQRILKRARVGPLSVPLPVPAPAVSSVDDLADILLRDARTQPLTSATDREATDDLQMGDPARAVLSDAGEAVAVNCPAPDVAARKRESVPAGVTVAPALGNIFLSSCPGKKVRLGGPVKGRVGVCRDLRSDLARIKALGVGCIVCCLDDSELDFLGASWATYARVAGDLGLDVLRMPTPEGLAPLTPARLDAHLARLLGAYTLAGVPLLVHCRGGVGRAGLVACCWLLKLGLCGWIETDPRPADRAATVAGTPCGMLAPGAAGTVRRDTMQLVERVIGVVRRRRSVKAVETYEQVKFLVDFVEYLRASGGGAPVRGGPAGDGVNGEIEETLTRGSP